METRPCVVVSAPDRDSQLSSVIDISGSGLRIRCGAKLPLGTLVRLGLGPLLVTAEVRYCERSGEATFDAGLRIVSAQTLEVAMDFLEYVPELDPVASGATH